jgi:hypothetical protein
MMESATGSARLPVNETGVKERMLVRAALIDHDAQLQNFTPLRDRLVASGQDANAKYREIQAERDQLWAKWKKLAPTPSPVPFPALPGAAVSSLPIAPLRLIGPGGLGAWFGYSGSVQMGPAQVGEIQIPPGVSGSISTDPNGLLPNGSILFTADLMTSSKAAIWLNTWKYLIVFPAPVVKSVFTYSFGVGVYVTLWGAIGSGTFLSFVSLGETTSYTGPDDIDMPVNNDGYPLVASLGAASIQGVLNVQRSFFVGAGEAPAIAVVMGVATALSAGSAFAFTPNGNDCFICPAATIDPATAVGPPAERGVVNFHYQPLLAELQA